MRAGVHNGLLLQKSDSEESLFYSEPLAICFFCRRNKFCLYNVYAESLNAAELILWDKKTLKKVLQLGRGIDTIY